MLKIELRSMVVKNPTSAVSVPGEKLDRRSLFLAAAFVGAAGLVAAQTAAPPAAPPTSVAPPAPAQPVTTSIPAGIRIGVIQAELALLQTRDGQAAQAEMERKTAPKREQLQKQKQDIDELQTKFEKGSSTMQDAAKAELQRTIQAKTRNLQRDAQDAQDEQTAEENKVLAELEEKMKAVITKFAVDNGLSLILNVASENTPVLWMSPSLDITQAIIEAYDKAYPNAKVTTPRPAVSPKQIAPTSPKPPAAAPKQ
jgi:Skp family chaperone for outer membrane proteins